MQTQQMNDNQWKIAHDLASELHNSGTDINEFGKVVAFMRRYQKSDNVIAQFISLLQRLANSNDAFSRSGRTPKYYQDIQVYCEKHLKGINDADELMRILGWCRRLMYYYKEEPKLATEEQLPQQEQPKIKIGARVNAKILKKEGFKVTVQLQTDEREVLVFEHPYFPGTVGEKKKLRVRGVSESGQVTKVVP